MYKDFQKYIGKHPLKDYTEEEDYARWQAFMHELAPTLKKLAKR